MFIGSKLQALRELNGYSRKELSEKLEVTEQAIWQYETESTMPKSVTLQTIQEMFNVRPAFLMTGSAPSVVVHEANIAYRAKDRSSRKKTKMEASYLNFADALVTYFERFVTGDQTGFRTLYQKVQQIMPGENTPARIRMIANVVRQQMALTDNRDLMAKVERMGVYVVEKKFGEQIDAYSTITDSGRAWIVLGSEKKSAVRHNFDLAHELGHLFLHTTLDFEILTVKEHKEIENEAHLFAAELLLPVESFTDDFSHLSRRSNPDAYLDMKQHYQVSITAMAMHARALGLMSYQELRYFFGQRTKKGYQTMEPLDDKLVPVRPGRLRALTALLFDKHVLTVGALMHQLKITPVFVTQLFALDANFFDKYQRQSAVRKFDNVILFPRRT